MPGAIRVEPIRVLVVDDEPLTRASIASKLRTISDVQVVGEAGDIAEARKLAATERPDALFVDIMMPGGTGIDLAGELGRDFVVVFVTAHDDFAVEAFELDAADYLTKPVRPARLNEAVSRIRRAMQRTVRPDQPDEIGSEEANAGAWQDLLLDDRGYVSHFVARKNNRIRLVPVADLLWAEAAGNYVRLHTVSGEHLIRSPVYELEAVLDPSRFRRIHRSTIVGLAEIEEIISDGHGSFDVRLHSGQLLRLTRTYRPNIIP